MYLHNWDNPLIIWVIYLAKLPNILQFQILQDGVWLSSVLYHYKMNMCEFWTVGWIKQTNNLKGCVMAAYLIAL